MPFWFTHYVLVPLSHIGLVVSLVWIWIVGEIFWLTAWGMFKKTWILVLRTRHVAKRYYGVGKKRQIPWGKIVTVLVAGSALIYLGRKRHE